MQLHIGILQFHCIRMRSDSLAGLPEANVTIHVIREDSIMKKTFKMKVYMVKFTIRLLVFVSVLLLYCFHRDWMVAFMTQNIRYGITPIHILWLLFMGTMALHLFPNRLKSMALLKMKEDKYVPVEGYSEYELLKYVQTQNQKAWIVMLVWLSCHAVIGFLYLFDILDDVDLLMLTVFYYLCDYICILFFCPFQSVIMKNRCCVNCRIYDWGHFMMFTPMLFIRNFFSWSLFFASCIVLIRWEIVYARHPERFFSGSNQVLQCSHCKDRTCGKKKNVNQILKIN